MPRKPEEQLIMVSAEMTQTQIGREWLVAFAAYVDTQKDALVIAPREHLDFAQGVARQGTILLKLLNESREKAGKIIQAEQAAAIKQKDQQK